MSDNQNFDKYTVIGVDPEGSTEFIHCGQEINLDENDYALIPIENIYIDDNGKKYPHIFTFTEHSVSNKPYHENIAIIYYTNGTINHEEQLAQSCLKHPYFVARNLNNGEDEDEYFPVHASSFEDDIDPWNAFVFNNREITNEKVEEIRKLKKL